MPRSQYNDRAEVWTVLSKNYGLMISVFQFRNPVGVDIAFVDDPLISIALRKGKS